MYCWTIILLYHRRHRWQGIHCSGSRLYDLKFFPIFSFKQTRGGSYHRSYKLDKERVSLSPNDIAWLLSKMVFRSRVAVNGLEITRVHGGWKWKDVYLSCYLFFFYSKLDAIRTRSKLLPISRRQGLKCSMLIRITLFWHQKWVRSFQGFYYLRDGS